jgi:SAM-dependent methyltransferase
VVGHPAGLAEGRAQQAAPLTPAAARLLLSPEGRAAVEAASACDLSSAARLATAAELGAALGPVLGPLALDQALLRARALAKHPRGDELWWTGDALEQASSHAVAQHRTGRFSSPVVDLCCGVGGDLLPLAAAHGGGVGVDLDEARLLLAQENARVMGLPVSLVRADVTRLALPRTASVFVDPARRAGRRRVFDPRAYSPPLDEVLALDVRELGVKVAPGIDFDALPDRLEVELVSLRGEVKEAVLWAGETRTGAARSATLLPEGHRLEASGAPVPRVAPPGDWLLEPDGAVIRAHLVAEVAQQVDGWLLDATIAYVAAAAPVPTPFGRWYEVLEVLPFSLKRLRARLRELDAGTLVVKKRGTAVEPEELRRRLRLTGSREVTVVLTRSAGEQVVLVVRPA